MVPEVPLVELSSDRWPGGASAPKVADGQPHPWLAEVASSEGPDAKILALVTRESPTPFGIEVRVWLLQLEEGDGSSYEWADFIPLCEHCPMKMCGVLQPSAAEPCPVCHGRKGIGSCFQFDCPRTAARPGCEQVKPEHRPVYCGSHPYFGGYALSQGWLGTTGPPLLGFLDVSSSGGSGLACLGLTCHTGLHSDGSSGVEAYIFSENPINTRHVTVDLDSQSVLSSVDAPDPIIRDAYSFMTSTLLAVVPQGPVTHTYILIQCAYKFSVLHRTGGAWSMSAMVSEGSIDFYGRLCKVSERLVVGLAKDGLWALDLPVYVSDAGAPMTAVELAAKLCWRRVLRLPEEKDVPDYDYNPRLLACGPEQGQAVIFALDGLDAAMMRPRLLVEFRAASESRAQVLRIRHLTSILGVPRGRQQRDVDGLVHGVLRVSGSRRGYLLFTKFGDVFHLRDEAIIPVEHAWHAPEFKASCGGRQTVSFRFTGEGQRHDLRVSLVGPLLRFEYFQKLLGSWQEGATLEVEVSDVGPDTFDSLLAYVYTGAVDSGLSLAALVRLLEAANKYLLPGLAALTILHILRQLELGDELQSREAGEVAELLTCSEALALTFPALQRHALQAILLHRSDVIEDEAFLTAMAVRSPAVLAKLLSVVRLGFEESRAGDARWMWSNSGSEVLAPWCVDLEEEVRGAAGSKADDRAQAARDRSRSPRG